MRCLMLQASQELQVPRQKRTTYWMFAEQWADGKQQMQRPVIQRILEAPCGLNTEGITYLVHLIVQICMKVCGSSGVIEFDL